MQTHFDELEEEAYLPLQLEYGLQDLKQAFQNLLRTSSSYSCNFYFQILLLNDQTNNTLSIQTWWWLWKLFSGLVGHLVNNGRLDKMMNNLFFWLIEVSKHSFHISFWSLWIRNQQNFVLYNISVMFSILFNLLPKIQSPSFHKTMAIYSQTKWRQITIPTSPPANNIMTCA